MCTARSLPAACASAASSAVRMAVLVTVAPLSTSTSELPAARMASGSEAMALPPMAAVSLGPSTATSRIACSSTVTVTVTFPPKPAAVAV